MKIICKDMKGKLLELINNLQVQEYNGKHLEFTDVIPTIRISKCFVTNSFSREVSEDTVLEEIEKSIKGNRYGIRCIMSDGPSQIVMRKGIKEDNNYKAIENIIALVDIADTDGVIFLYDSITPRDVDGKVIEINLTKDDKFHDLCQEFIKESAKPMEEDMTGMFDKVDKLEKVDFNKKVFENSPYQNVGGTMTVPMVISAHTNILWKAIESDIPKNELVELEDGEDSIGFIRDEMIKQNKIKGFMIPYLCKMDNFIFSNLCDTVEHKRLISKVWEIIHDEIPKYHKDKKENKDFTFSDNVSQRIKAYLKEDLGIDIEVKKEEFIPKDKSIQRNTEEVTKEDIKLKPKEKPELITEVKAVAEEKAVELPKKEYIPIEEEKLQFEKELAEVDKTVKEIEGSVKETAEHLYNRFKKNTIGVEKIMVRKIKSNTNKKQEIREMAAENEGLKASVRVAYNGVIKSILVHMQTWDLEDLVEVLLTSRNDAVKLYEAGKDRERNREIIVALQRCAMWISEVWRNKQDGIHTIYCVEMEPSEFIFAIERAGVPWVIDSKTLGMILQFESPNKELDLIDLSKEEFVKKHMEFMRASGLLNPLMHDDLNIIPVESIVKRDK